MSRSTNLVGLSLVLFFILCSIGFFFQLSNGKDSLLVYPYFAIVFFWFTFGYGLVLYLALFDRYAPTEQSRLLKEIHAHSTLNIWNIQYTFCLFVGLLVPFYFQAGKTFYAISIVLAIKEVTQLYLINRISKKYPITEEVAHE